MTLPLYYHRAAANVIAVYLHHADLSMPQRRHRQSATVAPSRQLATGEEMPAKRIDGDGGWNRQDRGQLHIEHAATKGNACLCRRYRDTCYLVYPKYVEQATVGIYLAISIEVIGICQFGVVMATGAFQHTENVIGR